VVAGALRSWKGGGLRQPVLRVGKLLLPRRRVCSDVSLHGRLANCASGIEREKERETERERERNLHTDSIDHRSLVTESYATRVSGAASRYFHLHHLICARVQTAPGLHDCTTARLHDCTIAPPLMAVPKRKRRRGCDRL